MKKYIFFIKKMQNLIIFFHPKLVQRLHSKAKQSDLILYQLLLWSAADMIN